MFNRRFVLALVAALGLAGCAGTVSQQQAQQLAAIKASAIAVEGVIASAVPPLLAAANVPPATAAEINSAVADISQAVTALEQIATPAAGVPYVRAIEAAVNQVVTAAAPGPALPSKARQELNTRALLLPALEAAVNQQIGG